MKSISSSFSLLIVFFLCLSGTIFHHFKNFVLIFCRRVYFVRHTKCWLPNGHRTRNVFMDRLQQLVSWQFESKISWCRNCCENLQNLKWRLQMGLYWWDSGSFRFFFKSVRCLAYFCAQKFPRCNENQDGPLPVCRDTCQELIDKCGPTEGVTEQLCNALPELECTSLAAFLAPLFSLIGATLFGLWFFFKRN